MKQTLRTKHGRLIDASMVLCEEPMPDGSRWQKWSMNPEHPSTPPGGVGVWMSRVYIVQLIRHPIEAWWRLSIRRIDGAEIRERWDDLQLIKDELLGVDAMAIEVYPPAFDVLQDCPMRHLFVVPSGFDLPCVWRRSMQTDHDPLAGAITSPDPSAPSVVGSKEASG